MPKFEIGIKKVSYGHAIVYAKDEEEARNKCNHGAASKLQMYGGEDTQQMDCKQRYKSEE